jgi:hypothetical protein
MGNTDFAGLYFYAFIFGIAFAVMYDVLWVFRVFFFGNRLVWLTDVLATSSAGIFISVLQYNFSSGKFRILPFAIFPLGVFFIRLTFSKILRKIINKIIQKISDVYFKIKVSICSFILRKRLLKMASLGFKLCK